MRRWILSITATFISVITLINVHRFFDTFLSFVVSRELYELRITNPVSSSERYSCRVNSFLKLERKVPEIEIDINRKKT